MNRPVRVAVMGSCTTRDNFNSRFNPDYKQMWDCVLLQNQSSLLSIMAPPLEISEDQLGEVGAFTRDVVRSDFTKEFLDRIVELAPDYLVMDFFGDIHFGCLRVEGGTLVTDNRWHLWKTAYYQSLKDAGKLDHLRIQDDVEAYVALWTDAYDRLVAHLRTHLPDLRLVVHRGYNTHQVLVDGTKVMPLREFKNLRRLQVKKMNKLWARLDDYAVEAGDADEIDLTGRGYTSFDDHPWGAFYVHYTMDYYRDFLAQLNLIHLRRALTGGERTLELQMLDQVVEADRARADLRVGRKTRQVKRLRGRVEGLENEVAALRAESPVRAVRRTLGRAVRARLPRR